MMKPVTRIMLALGLSLATAFGTAAMAANSHNNGRSHGHGGDDRGHSRALLHRPGSRSGLIGATRHIYAPGDTIRIGVVFPRSLRAFWDGEADAHIALFHPDLGIFTGLMDIAQPDRPRMLFELDGLDTTVLPEGDYQLALILTVPGGDPTMIADWFGGFTGLVSVTRIRLTAAAEAGDADDDGEFDDDMDGDGFEDDMDSGANSTALGFANLFGNPLDTLGSDGDSEDESENEPEDDNEVEDPDEDDSPGSSASTPGPANLFGL